MNMFDLSPPADEDGAIAALKWMVAVMDRDDKSLHFVASVLSSCCKYGGLTERYSAAPVTQSELRQHGIHRLADRHPSKIAVVIHGATIAQH